MHRGLPYRAAPRATSARTGYGRRSNAWTERSRERSLLPSLGDVLDFMRLLWRVDHALRLTSKRMESALGVTGPQRLVLRILGKHPGMPAGRLAGLLHLHPSTLTGIVKRLDRKGLVVRRADPADARRVLLGLTRKGRSLDVATEGTVEFAIEATLRRSSNQATGRTREFLVCLAEELDVRCAAIASDGRMRADR